MNNTIEQKRKNVMIFAKIVATYFLFFGLVGVCAGQEAPKRLEVIFNPIPLFGTLNGTENFLPADVAEGAITVINNSGEDQDILVEAINVIDDEGLGDELVLTISDGVNTFYDESFGTFGEFLRMGELSLSSLIVPVTPAPVQTTYFFTVEYKEDSIGPQGAIIGFDICIGFEGEDGVACGNTSVGNEHDTGGGDDGGENETVIGGGGYIPMIPLTVYGEGVLGTGDDGSGEGMVTIEWNTNKLATSKVVYGLSKNDDGSSITYILDLNDENFGYPFGTDENTPKITEHTVVITGLLPGREYKYRVVSRASPPTISYEHTFFVEMEVGELDEEGSSGFQTEQVDIGQGSEEKYEGILDVVDIGEDGMNFLSFLGDTADLIENILLREKIENNVNSNRTGNNMEKNDVRSGNLTASVFPFLDGNLNFGEVILILLLLFALIVVWFIISKRLKKNRNL
ncbi:MAG: fibronectin type III domain-containing protein [Candidatus Pacebacteria bacterium]|nr:fibronectin type III domain-containing protein [Candidatus Paceibacterota bacterium]